jgi:hypothetical protein
VAWHHRLVGDRVTPYFDPVRYERAGKKDFILMLGADLKGYDVRAPSIAARRCSRTTSWRRPKVARSTVWAWR